MLEQKLRREVIHCVFMSDQLWKYSVVNPLDRLRLAVLNPRRFLRAYYPEKSRGIQSDSSSPEESCGSTLRSVRSRRNPSWYRGVRYVGVFFAGLVINPYV